MSSYPLSPAPLRTVLLLVLAISSANAQSSSFLARLDEIAPKFSAATANFTWLDHLAGIETEEKQSGTVVIKRTSATRAQFVARFTQPNEYAVALRENTVERYTPRNNLIQEYDISNYHELAQTLMLLGFGMTGRQLASSFEITGLRSESVSGQKATHLDLKARAPEFRKHVSRIELWISDELGCAIQQKFHYPDASYKLVTFTNLRLNPKLDAGALQLPKGAKRERIR
jgi:outer membrane lipoprotein-sorting protein